MGEAGTEVSRAGSTVKGASRGAWGSRDRRSIQPVPTGREHAVLALERKAIDHINTMHRQRIQDILLLGGFAVGIAAFVALPVVFGIPNRLYIAALIALGFAMLATRMNTSSTPRSVGVWLRDGAMVALLPWSAFINYRRLSSYDDNFSGPLTLTILAALLGGMALAWRERRAER